VFPNDHLVSKFDNLTIKLNSNNVKKICNNIQFFCEIQNKIKPFKIEHEPCLTTKKRLDFVLETIELHHYQFP